MIASDAGIPSVRTETAASAGPTARARLYVTELRPTAEARSGRETSCGNSALESFRGFLGRAPRERGRAENGDR